jgi:NADPH:quinone reductase-like Zn-dependent oxidoreductase
VFFITKPKRADLEALRGMCDDKTLVPVIDRTFALPELAEAMRYLESGSSHGKVVVTMDA